MGDVKRLSAQEEAQDMETFNVWRSSPNYVTTTQILTDNTLPVDEANISQGFLGTARAIPIERPSQSIAVTRTVELGLYPTPVPLHTFHKGAETRA